MHTHTHTKKNLDSRQPNDTLSMNSFNKTPSKGGFLLGTTASSTADPICDQQHQQRVQVYYPSVYYTTGGEQMIRSAGGFLQESNLSSSPAPNVTTAEYGFSCVDPSSNTCIITTRKPSSGGGGTRQHVYDIPHRFKKEPTAVCLMSQSSTVCFVPDASRTDLSFLVPPLILMSHEFHSVCVTKDEMSGGQSC